MSAARPDPFARLREQMQPGTDAAARMARLPAVTAASRAADAFRQIGEPMRRVAAHVEQVTAPLREAVQHVTIAAPAAAAVARMTAPITRMASWARRVARAALLRARRASRAALLRLRRALRPSAPPRGVQPVREVLYPPGSLVDARTLSLSLVAASHAPPMPARTPDLAARVGL